MAPSKKEEVLGIRGSTAVTRTRSALGAAGNVSYMAFIISWRHTLINVIQHHVTEEGNFRLGSLRKQDLWDHKVCQSSVMASEPGQPPFQATVIV